MFLFKESPNTKVPDCTFTLDLSDLNMFFFKESPNTKHVDHHSMLNMAVLYLKLKCSILLVFHIYSTTSYVQTDLSMRVMFVCVHVLLVTVNIPKWVCNPCYEQTPYCDVERMETYFGNIFTAYNWQPGLSMRVMFVCVHVPIVTVNITKWVCTHVMNESLVHYL